MRSGYSVIIIFRIIDCQVNVIQDSVILAVLYYGHGLHASHKGWPRYHEAVCNSDRHVHLAEPPSVS